jgi:hypothetical protein
MTHVRAAKVERMAQDAGTLDLVGEPQGDVLVLGWGGTYGALRPSPSSTWASSRCWSAPATWSTRSA